MIDDSLDALNLDASVKSRGWKGGKEEAAEQQNCLNLSHLKILKTARNSWNIMSCCTFSEGETKTATKSDRKNINLNCYRILLFMITIIGGKRYYGQLEKRRLFQNSGDGWWRCHWIEKYLSFPVFCLAETSLKSMDNEWNRMCVPRQWHSRSCNTTYSRCFWEFSNLLPFYFYIIPSFYCTKSTYWVLYWFSSVSSYVSSSHVEE